MFIESLTIRKNGKEGSIIRRIKFSKGVNLIVDQSDTSKNTETGNNVGKTTVLRLIDFCLGAKKENIYQDPEFKGRNEKSNNIKQFLEDNQVYIELVLTKDLTNPDAKKITIGRNFLKTKNKIQEINGEPVSNENLGKELGNLIFGSQFEFDNPSFRQIICRNIRHSSDALNKTLKPLHPTTSNSEYEILYLYWLGVNSDSSKIQLDRDLQAEKKYYKQVEGSQGDNLNTIRQKIITYENEIKELNIQREQFNLNENYTQDLEQLNLTKQSLNSLRTQISALNVKKDLIFESQAGLDNTHHNIEKEKVKSLYSEAKSLLPNLQKRFEDILEFHNQMMKEKKQFIGKELPQIDLNLQQHNRKMGNLLIRETSLSDKLQKTGAIEELEILVQQLTQKHEDKGRLEKVKELLYKSQSKSNGWEQKLKKINEQLKNKNDAIEKIIASFNEYFGNISDSLYSQKFLVSHQFSENQGQINLKLTITGLEDNPGTGGKKGEIVAFDLAYIQFAEKEKIPHLNFVLHDQIENIHDNQINIILLDVVQKINCQYIVPVLQDKLPPEINLTKYSVLSLSQNEKLFKI